MNRPQYTQEFKDEAVRQVLEGSLSLAQVARSLKIHPNTLSTWKKSDLKWHGDPSALKDGEEPPRPNWPACAGRIGSCGWSKRF